MEIQELKFDSVDRYTQVPIAFEVGERFFIGGDVTAINVPWVKDYDAYPGEGPRSYASWFDISNWGILAAFEGSRILGGVMLAFRCPEFDLLDGRDDLVHIVDIRVVPESRSTGIGRRLWEAAEAWSRARGATTLRVETQDINVPACRFYQAMGCALVSCSSEAYGPEIDELQLIWGKEL